MLLGTPSGPTSDCQARAQRGTDFGPAGFRGDFSGAFVCPEVARFVTAALVSARESAATFEVPVTARPAVQQDERTRRMRKSLTVLGSVLSVIALTMAAMALPVFAGDGNQAEGQNTSGSGRLPAATVRSSFAATSIPTRPRALSL